MSVPRLALLVATAPLASGALSADYQLPARLRTVFDLVAPGMSTVADVGADHGILSAALAVKVPQVYATDLSPAAASRAAQLFSKLGLEQRVSLEVGFGLRPLLRRGLAVDSLVLSGMGAQAALQILSDDPLARFDDTDASGRWRDLDYPRFSLAALDELNVRQLILQPWPPHILPLHYLCKLLVINGWKYQAQRITASQGRRRGNEYHHLVTSFIRSSSANTGMVSDDIIFNGLPLNQLFSRDSLRAEESICWKGYLIKQSESLRKRIQSRQTENSLPELLSRLIGAIEFR